MRRTLLGLVIPVVFLAACGDDGGSTIDAPAVTDASAGTDAAIDAAPQTFFAAGTVIGPGAPAAGPVAVVWSVVTGNDYLYKFGDGSSSGTTFTVGLAGDPPVAARNVYAMTDLGVGLVALLPPGTSLAEGMLLGAPASLGLSARFAIIFRGPTDTGALLPWTTAFPFGLSCGHCAHSTTGFDTFLPVDCATLMIDTDQNTAVCNWS